MKFFTRVLQMVVGITRTCVPFAVHTWADHSASAQTRPSETLRRLDHVENPASILAKGRNSSSAVGLHAALSLQRSSVSVVGSRTWWKSAGCSHKHKLIGEKREVAVSVTTERQHQRVQKAKIANTRRTAAQHAAGS